MTILNLNTDDKSVVRFNLSENPSHYLDLDSKYLGIAAGALRSFQEGRVKGDVVISERDPNLGYIFEPSLNAMVKCSVTYKPGSDEVMYRIQYHQGRMVLCDGYMRDWVRDGLVKHSEWAYCGPHLAYLMSLGVEVRVTSSPYHMGKLARQIEYSALPMDARLDFDFRQ